MDDCLWPIPEVSLDEKRRTGKRSKAATQEFRAIRPVCGPFRTVRSGSEISRIRKLNA